MAISCNLTHSDQVFQVGIVHHPNGFVGINHSYHLRTSLFQMDN